LNTNTNPYRDTYNPDSSKCMLCSKNLLELECGIDYCEYDDFLGEMHCLDCLNEDWPQEKRKGYDGSKRSHWVMKELSQWQIDRRVIDNLLQNGADYKHTSLEEAIEIINYHHPHLKAKKHFPPINIRIKNSLRSRLYAFVKGKNANSSFEFVGCSIDELKKHLSSQFTEGMSWKNYGEWHIDHIKPCSSFDLSIEEQQHKCFHYSNLQPLWAKDNLKKGAKEMKV